MPGEQREAHIGRTLGSVAPSMLLCSLSEAICFFLGEQGLSFSTQHQVCWVILRGGTGFQKAVSVPCFKLSVLACGP